MSLSGRQLSLFEPTAPAPRRRERSRPGMRYCVLGSGSGGNSVVVEHDGRRLLLDAGFSARELERRLRAAGVEPASIEAIVLTHEHDDHCRGASRFSRLFGTPVLASTGTLRCHRLRGLEAKAFRSGSLLECAGFSIETVPVPHDARDPVALVVEDAAGARLGLVGDLGRPTHRAWARLRGLDVLLLEANHDLDMLRRGPYPWRLKRRVAGARGHLSNETAADSLLELLDDDLHTVVLYHLSRINNTPALARDAVTQRIERAGGRVRVSVSDQFEPTPWLEA